MPLTPYHVGPALLVALLLYPLLDIPTFLVANVILDLEPLAVLLGLADWSLHSVFHSFTVGSLVAGVLAGLMYLLRRFIPAVPIGRVEKKDYTLKEYLIASVSGVWMHILFDAFLYTDLNLFYPLKWNPLAGLIPQQTIINICLISLPVAFIVYLIRTTLLTWISPKKEQVEEVKEEPVPEHVLDGIPENEPYLIYYDPDSVKESEPKQEPVPEPKPRPKTTPEPVIEPLYIPEPVWIQEPEPEPIYTPQIITPEPREELIKNEIQPDIVLGVDKPPVQWGIVGKSGMDKVAVDLNEPHIVFVCGKQGSGKGYSIGVITEMLLSKTIPNISQVKRPATVIVFHKPREDMRSEFWSIIDPNLNFGEVEVLKDVYDVAPQRVIDQSKFRIFIDPFVYENERSRFEEDYGTKAYPIAINPSRLTAEDWPYVLSIGRKSGSMYVKKIFQIIKKTQYDNDFGLDKIRRYIDASDLNPNQKGFAAMRLETLEDYLEGGDFLKNLMIGGVNIFDLRKIMMEPDDIFSVMMLVISSLLNDTRTEREQFVFVINEAHDYLRKGLSKEFTDYINYLIRKKRHAGTWLMLDTHFPEDVDPKVIKGSDIKIFHKSDVISSNLLKQVVEGTPIPPHHLETGQAIIRADKSNLGPDCVLIVQVRPRLTHHGGATKTAV